MPDLARRPVLRALGAGAAGLLAGAGMALPGARAGGSIHARIWDADQAGSGVEPVRPGAPRNPERGYVVVDEDGGGDPAHRLFPEVVIPDRKRRTYELAKALFDNYAVAQQRAEEMDQAEADETLTLLEAVAASPPMSVVREAFEQQSGRALAAERWLELLFEMWFRPYAMGRNVDLSGFEHVVVGEANGEAVSGHHFWYRYYLDDGILGEDRVDWRGTRYDGPGGRVGRRTPLGRSVPAVVTLSYRWRTAAGNLLQEIGGFFVGCSVEGLMALGTARFLALGQPEAVIGGARVKIVLHTSPDGRSLRTFYPKFIGVA